MTEWSWGILEDVDSLLEINLVQHNILVALVILLEVKNERDGVNTYASKHGDTHAIEPQPTSCPGAQAQVAWQR